MTPKPAFGPELKITNHVIPLSSPRAYVGRGGQVVLLVGYDTVWVLRADRQRLVRPAEAEF